MKSNDKTLLSGDFSFIRNIESNKYLDIATKSGKDLKQAKKELDHNFVTTLRGRRNDNQLFRLYKASSDNIWEINYVLSSFRRLTSFIVS